MSIGNIVQWDWDFGDNTPNQSLQNPYHTYEDSIGIYQISLIVTNNPNNAVIETDIVMTDKWISMNDKVNKKQKKKLLKPYQVNNKLMKKAKPNAIFMHCLPVGRGEEVTDEVIDGDQSVVWRQALNRVHAQKAIIKWCIS